METSFFLAALLAPILLVAGIGVLVNRGYYRTLGEEFLNSKPLVYLASVIGFVAGLAVVLVHNEWALDWRVLITLLAWAQFVRGAAFLLAPERAIALSRRMLKSDKLLLVNGVIAIIIGLIFFYQGY